MWLLRWGHQKTQPCGTWNTEHLLLIEVYTLWKCFNGVLEACPKKSCQHVFFLVRPLFCQESLEFRLSVCGLPLCLPSALKGGIAMLNRAEGSRLREEHHQHCSSREISPSNKSLAPSPCSATPPSHPYYLILHLEENRQQRQQGRKLYQPHGDAVNPEQGEFQKKGKAIRKWIAHSEFIAQKDFFFDNKNIFDSSKSKRWCSHLRIHSWARHSGNTIL